MVKFECVVYLTVRYKNGELHFTRDLDLPFPPFKGLRVSFNEAQCDYVKIHLVEWSAEKEVFWCYAVSEFGDDCQCGPEEECCTMSIETVDHYSKLGWEAECDPYWLKDNLWMRKDWQFTAEQLGVTGGVEDEINP